LPLMSAGKGYSEGVEVFVENRLTSKLYGQGNLSRLTLAGSRPCSTRKPAAARTLRAASWRPPRTCGLRRTGARRRDVSAGGIHRRSRGTRVVASLQASRVAPGAAVTRLRRSSWRPHHRDERLGTRRSLEARRSIARRALP
jgi:hypothetical protein